jgi:murein DD-endopeptidase MepM/ murein hydrolase activator NlpD
MPVFKAFGLSPDGRKLLYSPLKDGRPSGLLYLEDLLTGKRAKVTSRLVLSASMSPVNSSQIAYTFADKDGFGLGLSDMESKRDKTMVATDVYSEIIEWNNDGGGIHYFNTAPTEERVELNSPYSLDNAFSRLNPWEEQGDEPSLVRLAKPDEKLILTPQFVTYDGQISSNLPPAVPLNFPNVTTKKMDLIDFQFKPEIESTKSKESRTFRVFSSDGLHSVSGGDLVGSSELVINNDASDSKVSLGEGVLARVLENGVVVKEFGAKATTTKYVDWAGNATVLGVTAVNYRLPEANSTMIQGGASYPSPGNCNLSAHYETMGYAYDFQNLTVGAHALAVADGLVVYASGSMTCNQIQQGCPDFSATGCPGYFLGNQVIVQHADGTYSAFSHLQTNSIQVAVGTSVCQGLYVARQGHTGSVSGSFNSCGDHLHFQRQTSPDPLGQSIPATFSDVAVHPLSCGAGYNTSSTEIVHSITTTSQNFPIPGGTGTVGVTSNGCTWNALSNNSWITITSPGSGSGNGTVGGRVR